MTDMVTTAARVKKCDAVMMDKLIMRVDSALIVDLDKRASMVVGLDKCTARSKITRILTTARWLSHHIGDRRS